MNDLPKNYRRDISVAIKILREGGCEGIYLFGSLGEGKVHEGSDIDLAVRGCPKGKFFNLYGRLIFSLNHSVDLVDLDKQTDLADFLERQGSLVKIG